MGRICYIYEYTLFILKQGEDYFTRNCVCKEIILNSHLATKSGSLDYWRKSFRSTSSDIFEVIVYAITVAAFDRPEELRIGRADIIEKLYSCQLLGRVGCDHRAELAVPDENGGFEGGDFGEKESRVNADGEAKRTAMFDYSYDEAEASTREIEQESPVVEEVMRIKDVLSNRQDMSNSVLIQSLKRLQSMKLSLETLKATMIGKTVYGLKKHGVNQIQVLAHTLIK